MPRGGCGGDGFVATYNICVQLTFGAAARCCSVALCWASISASISAMRLFLGAGAGAVAVLKGVKKSASSPSLSKKSSKEGLPARTLSCDSR